MNPTLSSLPAAASLRQDNGCTYAAGTETYTDYGDGTTTKTLTYAPTGSAVPSNAHIFNAFEDGFSSQQDNVISGWGCSTPSLLYDSTGGLDIGLAESKERKLCYDSEKNSFPNVQSDNSYRGTVGPCGGHTGDYHFHGRYHCLYEQTGEHSTKIGDVGPYIMYGKWEHFTAKQLPQLDACGAHIGITPDSPSEAVYHYHVQDRAPYGVGCYGDGVNLMTVSACRALYSTCGDGDETFTDMPQPDGTLKSFAYDRDCPCFDANGLNTDSSITERAIIAQPSVIGYDASKWTCGDGVSCMQTVEATLGFTDYVGKQDATKSPPSSPAHCDASVAPENGDIGNCTSTLPIGQTCRPVCADGFVLALSGKQSYCAPDGKLSYEAECVYDSCFILERNAAQERKQKPMNEIIVHPDGKDEKTVLVSKDEREMHVEVDTMRTRAKLISYANASTNNVVLSKRLIAGGENEEEIDVEKRLTELRKKAVELRERLLRVKYRYTPPPSPPPLPPSPPPSPPSPPPPSPPPSPPPLPPPLTPIPSASWDELILAYSYLGEGECRQSDGNYPIKFSIGYYDLNPHTSGTNAEQALDRCKAKCFAFAWCLAVEVVLRDIWDTPECRLVTDWNAYVVESTNTFQNNQWGGTQSIDGENYQTYCNGGLSPCSSSNVFDGGKIDSRDGYHCYLQTAT